LSEREERVSPVSVYVEPTYISIVADLLLLLLPGEEGEKEEEGGRQKEH